jgi:putative membrane protein
VTEPTGDATRRTWLASERTWLAWVRTGLTSTAVALGIGKITPELAKASTKWPYVVVGAGYALLGAALVAYGFARRDHVDRAIERGTYSPPGAAAVAIFAVTGVVLGLATFVVVLAD